MALSLTGRSADDLGWPDCAQVARRLADGVLEGCGPQQWGGDPFAWRTQVLEAAIVRWLPGPGADFDLRDLGWMHTPTFAAKLVDWLVEDGVLCSGG